MPTSHGDGQPEISEAVEAKLIAEITLLIEKLIRVRPAAQQVSQQQISEKWKAFLESRGPELIEVKKYSVGEDVDKYGFAQKLQKLVGDFVTSEARRTLLERTAAGQQTGDDADQRDSVGLVDPTWPRTNAISATTGSTT